MINSISTNRDKNRSKDSEFQIINHCVVEVSKAPKETLSNNNLSEFLNSLCDYMDFHIMNRFSHEFEPHGFYDLYSK